MELVDPNKNREIVLEKPVIKETPTFYEKLHGSLADKLFSIVGKKQVLGFGDVYFIPTIKELQVFMPRFIKNHKELYDEDKIIKVMTHHVERCARKRQYAPACKYFIYKDGTGSRLATALENYETEKEDIKKEENLNYDGINI